MPVAVVDDSHITHLRERMSQAVASGEVVFNNAEKVKLFLTENMPQDMDISPNRLFKICRSRIPLRLYVPKSEKSVLRDEVWHSGTVVADKLILQEFGLTENMIVFDRTAFCFDRKNCRLWST